MSEGCDDKEYIVTVLVQVTRWVKAVSKADAKVRAMRNEGIGLESRWPDSVIKVEEVQRSAR